MSYENAPATRLVATHCCVCARPLVDADSVECGIGPTCRRGMEPDTAPDWLGVADALGAWVDEARADAAELERRRAQFELAMLYVDRAQGGDDRKMANVLTHEIAATCGKTRVGGLVLAIQRMGRTKLAAALSSRLYDVRIKEDGRDLLVRAPYSDAFRGSARNLRARWDRDGKFYRVPSANRAPLFVVLKAAYAGKLAWGPKGEFAL